MTVLSLPSNEGRGLKSVVQADFCRSFTFQFPKNRSRNQAFPYRSALLCISPDETNSLRVRSGDSARWRGPAARRLGPAQGQALLTVLDASIQCMHAIRVGPHQGSVKRQEAQGDLRGGQDCLLRRLCDPVL